MKSRFGNTRMLSGKEGMAAEAAGILIKPVTPRVIAALTPRARFTPFRCFSVLSFNRPLVADCRGITAPCAKVGKGRRRAVQPLGSHTVSPKPWGNLEEPGSSGGYYDHWVEGTPYIG